MDEVLLVIGVVTRFSCHLQGFLQLRAKQEFTMVYAEFQPIVRLEDRKVVGYEALARKRRGGGGVLPSEWIQRFLVAPKRSFKLAEAMFKETVTALNTLHRDQFISINVEAREFSFQLDPLYRIAESTGIVEFADRVVIEISERGTLDDSAASLAEVIKTIGFRLAFDDIGAGMTRLIEIADLAPDMLKLDARILTRLDSKRMQIVLRGVTSVVKQLKCTTLIEGIESEEAALSCQGLGIELGQGFLFGRPGPISNSL